MFMPGMFAGAGFNNIDPEAEREPVPVPTPVTFPVRSTFSNTNWSEESPPPKLQSYFSRVVRPSDISASHVEALNIQLHYSCPPEDFLPLAPDGSSYLPPLSPSQAINSVSYADVAKESASLVKRRADLAERLTELRLNNDFAFRTITRTTKHGAKPARLAWLRKFWEGLESVAQYWDTSSDCYYEAVPALLQSEKGAKRLRMDSVQVGIKEESESDVTNGSTTRSSPVSSSTASNTSSHPCEVTGEGETVSLNTSSEPRKCWRYKGRRTASGRDMPDQFRADTVRAFVEAVVWPFDCAVAPPRHMPVVQMKHLSIPVRQTAAVYRNPKERKRARSGCLEGPIFAIQCRSDTDFHAPSMTIEQTQTRARLDLMRELGSLLQLAQERRRQGKVETRSGEGKWWTTEPRWGGGSGGEVLSDSGDADVAEVLPITEGSNGAASSRAPRKKRTPAMLWKELRCGSKLWDPRIRYEAIGKDPDSEWDEVFLVSSLNHHISILKLTVHGAYIEYLQSETLPDPLPIDKDWCSPKLQRSRWYDLLDVAQRVQAFRALWGITAYLTREIDSSAKVGAEDEGGMSD